jgi:hypothetical protein
MTSIPEFLSNAKAVVSAVPCTAADAGALTDTALVESFALAVSVGQASDLHVATLAAEIAQRSRYELGTDRLSSREGHKDATAMIQATLKSTKGEAARSIQVGTLLAETQARDRPDSPAPVLWHAPLGRAVAAGILTGAAAASIQRGLGTPCERVSEEALTAACEQIIAENADLNADQLYNLARSTRDEIDSDGVALREEERHAQRVFRSRRRADGMYAGSWLLGTEDGLLVDTFYRSIIGVRGGGARFVAEDDAARDAALEDDPRSVEQIAADGFVVLVTRAIDADTGTMIGERRPSVRAVVTIDALETGDGHGFLDGSPDAVSMATIARIACDTGTIGVMFSTNGIMLNLGRAQRLFSKQQRTLLGTRWGGCAHPECDRAPIDCEAHHIDEWVRDNGRTDIDRGITLCRRHHKLLHDNNQRIIREGNDYWLTDRAPAQSQPDTHGLDAPSLNGGTLGTGTTRPAKRIQMRSKNPIITTMMRNAGRKADKVAQRETVSTRT